MRRSQRVCFEAIQAPVEKVAGQQKVEDAQEDVTVMKT